MQTFYASGNPTLPLFVKIMLNFALCKTLSKGIEEGVVKFLVAVFSKKVPFLASIRRCPDFLD